ncbi:transcriptional regulator, TetR family [[Leptolyngbya] sp. PCC 7376]|uniref:TetR/AcrR family transcriptional regulator n=1 Tax=[Leptolyngbya] sp. PCC 7376 TaxID=111781 RepID=UPI00029EF7B9|nr:TetR/AcrR family transcriptional regulator [[Leptolyngbya] sp. PCC 7376]AFY37944.1 transcriptional regulator, TetR family [[Leptolyngbya] sp. PCC 7376]
MAKRQKLDDKQSMPLSRERILQAALHCVDADGLDALSMRKLAEGLGVKAMSLYNHVKNKDDIIDGIVELAIAEIERPDPKQDWRVAMRNRAISAHQVLLKHPWATMAIASRVNIGESSLSYVDATLGCLLEAGFSYEIADHIWNALDSYIYGFTLQELNFPFEASEYAKVAAEFVHLIPVDQYPYLNGLTHHVIKGQYNGIHNFEFGLDVLLAGFGKMQELSQK